jgi:acetylornithine deacetylase/succinyl-diaminopimelate desuccinylase-like protein
MTTVPVEAAQIEKIQRRSAQIALWSSLLLCAGLTVGLARWLTPTIHFGRTVEWHAQDYEAMREVQLLQQYLRIDTTSDRGNEVVAAEWLAARLAEFGVVAEIERIDERHANVYATVEGDDPSALILHHHIDTDPVDPDLAWRFGAFDGAIDGPWIFGRGAYDMKSVGVAQLVALERLLEASPRPRRTVRLIATSSEESGSDLGMDRVVRMRPEILDGAFAFLTEGGFVEPTDLDTIKYWATEVGQKRAVWVELCHGDRAALEAIRADLLPLSTPLDAVRLDPFVRSYLEEYGPSRIDPFLAGLLSDPERAVADLGLFARLPRAYQTLLRNEAEVWTVEPAPGGGWRLTVVLLLLPNEDPQLALERFVPPHLRGAAAMVVDWGHPSLISPLDHPAYLAIDRVLGRIYPEAPRGPAYLPVTSTDARFARAVGVPSYGFSPFLVFAADTLTMRAPNEKIGLPGYVAGVEAYAEVVQELAGQRSAKK